MRVVFYEPQHTGHHFAYLAHAIPAVADLGCDTWLLTTKAAASSGEFQRHLGPHADRMTVDFVSGEYRSGKSALAARRRLADLARAVRRVEPDHLYVAYGDGLVQVAGLAGLAGFIPWSANTATEVVLLRGGYKYRERNLAARLRARISPHLIRHGPWDRIHHLNPDDLQVLQNLGGEFGQRCRLMPDPVEGPPATTKAEARRALGIPEDGRYIGCAGMVDRRKGIDLLIAAFQAARGRLRADDRLLLAGPMAPEIRTLVEREAAHAVPMDQLVVVDRVLAPAEINLAVVAMDVVCTPYPLHLHSASIVIRAAAAERPVLASAIGWMERTVRRFQLGNTCCVLDGGAFSDGVVAALEASAEYVPTEAARRFAAFHRAPNFVAHWTSRIRERMGLPEAPQLIGWDWVVDAITGPRSAD